MADHVEAPPKLRNARACEACRASKSRCIYKSDREICQRCEESGNTCVVRAKARPMRSRGLRPSSTSGSAKYLMELPAVPSRNTVQDIEELNTHHKNIFGDDDRPIFPRSGSSEAQSLLKQRRITLDEAENLLLTYRGIASYFPFVQISLDTSVPLMSRNSPFLLLAILTAGSRSDPNLHHQLDHEFRRVLSQKIVIEGKKNLDFLQGLLVYIAWYPVHSNPKHSQTFVYMNLAISLAFDLGLDNDYPNPMSFTPIETKFLVEHGAFTTAAKRAYLGCYCLSAAISMGFQKPNSIQYRNLMDSRCLEMLQEDPSDEIYFIVKLQRFWEHLSEYHNTKDQELISQQSSIGSEAVVEMFSKELEDFGQPSDGTENTVFVGMLNRFVKIALYSYSLGFLRKPYRVMPPAPIQPVNINHEYKCLESCKVFFEYLLSLPEESFVGFTTIHWTMVVHATLVLTRLTFAMAADLGWDSNTTRTNIPMVMYLDCLCWRFQKLSSTQDVAGGIPRDIDPLYIFRMVLESLKRSYLRRVANIRPPSMTSDTSNTPRSSTGRCPVRDPDLNAYFESGFSSSSGSHESGTNNPSTIPVYFDIWSTMTGSWAEK